MPSPCYLGVVKQRAPFYKSSKRKGHPQSLISESSINQAVYIKRVRVVFGGGPASMWCLEGLDHSDACCPPTLLLYLGFWTSIAGASAPDSQAPACKIPVLSGAMRLLEADVCIGRRRRGVGFLCVSRKPLIIMDVCFKRSFRNPQRFEEQRTPLI